MGYNMVHIVKVSRSSQSQHYKETNNHIHKMLIHTVMCTHDG